MKWVSRKLVMANIGLFLYTFIPTTFKNSNVSDTVTLAALGGVTIIIGYYFKVNKDSKTTEVEPSKE